MIVNISHIYSPTSFINTTMSTTVYSRALLDIAVCGQVGLTYVPINDPILSNLRCVDADLLADLLFEGFYMFSVETHLKYQE